MAQVVSLLQDAETQVTKGYNHKAVDKLDEVTSQLSVCLTLCVALTLSDSPPPSPPLSLCL